LNIDFAATSSHSAFHLSDWKLIDTLAEREARQNAIELEASAVQMLERENKHAVSTEESTSFWNMFDL
jgi:hypothetical protein